MTEQPHTPTAAERDTFWRDVPIEQEWKPADYALGRSVWHPGATNGTRRSPSEGHALSCGQAQAIRERLTRAHSKTRVYRFVYMWVVDYEDCCGEAEPFVGLDAWLTHAEALAAALAHVAEHHTPTRRYHPCDQCGGDPYTADYLCPPDYHSVASWWLDDEPDEPWYVTAAIKHLEENRDASCDINEATHYCRTHHQDLDVAGITCAEYHALAASEAAELAQKPAEDAFWERYRRTLADADVETPVQRAHRANGARA